jgi:uncharacterized protein
MTRILFILMIFVLISCSGTERETVRERESAPGRELNFTSEVSFVALDGQIISTIQAAVADDDHTRSEGLMNVHHLPDDAGMLFIFEGNEPRSFWMANTPIPLDIIFVNSDFEIVRIHRNAVPYSHQRFRSEAPAKYVVEVNAGYTLQHDITEGLIISFTY